ncbi:MAG: hypothetical protein GYB68_02915, partial [Chloroflexi bacterium]|nr:hypothetical protein [Chloroflexota bacterium]
IDVAGFVIGWQAVVLAVSQENSFLECLSLDELVTLFGADAGIATWRAFGTSDSQGALAFFVSSAPDGGYEYFNEVVSGGEGTSFITQFLDDRTAIVNALVDNPGAVGLLTAVDYAANSDQLRTLAIAGNSGTCVQPTRSTIEDGSYEPLSRPLYLYFDVDGPANTPLIDAFLSYMLGTEGLSLFTEAVGYVSLTDDDIEALRTRYDAP